jgi:hypothetical protein
MISAGTMTLVVLSDGFAAATTGSEVAMAGFSISGNGRRRTAEAAARVDGGVGAAAARVDAGVDDNGQATGATTPHFPTKNNLNNDTSVILIHCLLCFCMQSCSQIRCRSVFNLQ